jgi:YqjK-like protein
MFVDKELQRLELRRRALIAQSEVQRAMLRLECVRLRPYLDHIDTGTEIFQKIRPYWLVALPALGALLGSRWRKLTTWVPTGVVAWGAIRKIWSMWSRSKSQLTESVPASPAATDQL